LQAGCFTENSQPTSIAAMAAVSNVATCGSGNELLGNNNFTFDTTSFDADARGQDTLDLLQDGIGDPAELLSYLGPSADGIGAGGGNSNPDDLLSLFS